MSDPQHEVSLQGYMRTCAMVFAIAVCAIGLMIWVSFLPTHVSWALKATLIVAIAAVNAFFVAGYLMHLLSEKKLVYTVLTCTAGFFVGLMGLTLWAMSDFPTGTAIH